MTTVAHKPPPGSFVLIGCAAVHVGAGTRPAAAGSQRLGGPPVDLDASFARPVQFAALALNRETELKIARFCIDLPERGRRLASTALCSFSYSAFNAARADSIASAMRSNVAWPVANSRIRASNPLRVTAPTFRPKPRSIPRMLKQPRSPSPNSLRPGLFFHSCRPNAAIAASRDGS
jgi:hypothetical protein